MSIHVNPLIVRELRGGLRSGRRVVLLSFCLTVIALFFLGLYAITSATLVAGSSGGSYAVGSAFFPMVVGVELFFICVMTPAQTAGAIVNERERQTYDVLLVTPLTPRQIVLGKLVSSLAYMVLVLVAALPIESLAFLMGGVDPDELVLASLLLLATLLFFGSLGLWASAIFRGGRAATAVAYALCGMFSLGLPLAFLFVAPLVGSIAQGSPSLTQQPPPWLIYTGEFFAATNPWSAAALTEAQLRGGFPLFWMHLTVTKTNVDLPGIWLVFLALYTAGSAACLHAAANAVRRRRVRG